MSSVNYAICTRCQQRVPAEHVIRDGRVFLKKRCPDCGSTEALVSSNPARWQRKRDICFYEPLAPVHCTLRCEICSRNHRPRMIFLDVTNRCNMNCPICIANVRGMGFEFHPPISYFEKVLAGLGRMQPKPTALNLFGGEPTLRDDLFDIVDLARRHGLDPRVVTNGIRLADEHYCRALCEKEIPVLMAFDGRHPAIYERLRKNPAAYYKKLKALDNLMRYSRRKITLMCCVARHINDRHMADLIQFCHDNRDWIKGMHLIPLTETWEAGEFETDIATTTEDVEQIVDEAFPKDKVEFFPMGPSESLKRSCEFLGTVPLRFGGIHPNCEVATYLVSDGTRYRPMGYYLKRPIDEIAQEMVICCRRIDARLTGLDPSRRLHRLWGRLIVMHGLAGLVTSSVNLDRLLKGNHLVGVLRILAGILAGRSQEELLRKHTNIKGATLMVVLPFEEYHSVESARLENCPSAFAYEDPETGKVRTVPVCMWRMYRNEVQRKVAAKYQAAPVPA